MSPIRSLSPQQATGNALAAGFKGKDNRFQSRLLSPKNPMSCSSSLLFPAADAGPVRMKSRRTIYPRSRSVFTNQKYEAFLCLMERLDAKDLRHTVLKNLNFRNKSREHIVLTQDGRFRITQADNGEDINS